MSSDTRLYDLLLSHVEQYDDETSPFEQFAVLWCEGRDPRSIAALLGADLGSARMCTLAGVCDDLDIQYGDGVILAGQAGAWALILQVAGCDVVLDETLMRLSEDGRRALSVSWDIGGNEEIGYAVNGAVAVRLSFILPEHRTGTDITALDPFMNGLRFDLEENGGSIEESISSAFVLAGRVTGEEIHAAWLDSPHERFVIPRVDSCS
ncbi:DUF6461 domain-containing protein [Streptosporangium sp. NPDC006013]|uniref:DUF6461 domain-containing protein n=1 Tax=Streptosporangium sp. NPDC006013 TaxID=3155596 RepID=UPI0033B405BB